MNYRNCKLIAKHISQKIESGDISLKEIKWDTSAVLGEFLIITPNYNDFRNTELKEIINTCNKYCGKKWEFDIFHTLDNNSKATNNLIKIINKKNEISLISTIHVFEINKTIREHGERLA